MVQFGLQMYASISVLTIIKFAMEIILYCYALVLRSEVNNNIDTAPPFKRGQWFTTLGFHWALCYTTVRVFTCVTSITMLWPARLWLPCLELDPKKAIYVCLFLIVKTVNTNHIRPNLRKLMYFTEFYVCGSVRSTRFPSIMFRFLVGRDFFDFGLC